MNGGSNAVVKRRNDDVKICSLERSGFRHQYDRVEWRPWTGNGYIKSWYELRLPDGTIIPHVWPNGGVMRIGNASYTKESGVEVRLSMTWPY